jgi:DNA-binding NarL/FixJ family response regulator
MTIRVATIDNHEIVRDGIASKLASAGTGLEIVASTATVEEYVGLGVRADVVLLDLMLEDGWSSPWIPDLVRTGARVLVYTTEERPVPLRRAVELGASGVLLKSDPSATVVGAVHDAVAGDFCCSGPTAHALLTDESTVADLSPRQVEILRALDEGLDYRHVAAAVGCSETTVKEQLRRTRDKFRRLGIDPGNSHHLTRLAEQQGHID